MNEGYYNKKGKLVSKAESDKERNRVIAWCIKDAENDDSLIDDEDLEFYLSELEKMVD